MCVDRSLPKAYYSHLLVYQMLPETYENANFMTPLPAPSISTEYTLMLVSVVDERARLPVLTSIPWCSGQMGPYTPLEKAESSCLQGDAPVAAALPSSSGMKPPVVSPNGTDVLSMKCL